MKTRYYQNFSAESTTTVLSGLERRYLDGVAEANEPAIAENRKIVVEIIMIV